MPALRTRAIASPSASRIDAMRKLPLSFTDRKSTRLNSSHLEISYAVFCLTKKLLWRRDRHGGQYLLMRPQRRSDADAMDGRPQRWLFPCRSLPALSGDVTEPGVPLPGRER